jgi:hypothetical protein
MSKRALTVMVLLLGAGCARFNTTQTDIRYDDQTGRPATAVTTRATATTFFAGKAALANWKATQSEGEQGAEVGQLDTEVTDAGHQLSTIIGAVTKGLAEGLK